MIIRTIKLGILTAALGAAGAASGAGFEQHFDAAAFGERTPGADFFWGGVDDENFAPLGVNPLGSTSYYDFLDPTVFGLSAAGALFGFVEASSVTWNSVLGGQMIFGADANTQVPTNGSLLAGSFDQNVFLDRAAQTPALDGGGNPQINVKPLVDVFLDPAFSTTGTFGPNNTASQFHRATGIVGNLENTTNEGYYLVNRPGENDPNTVFAGNQKVIDHFNAVLPTLDPNWTVVTTLHMTSSNLTTGLQNDVVFVHYSTDANAIPQDVVITGDVRLSTAADYSRAFVDTLLIGDSGIGRVEVGAGQEVELNSFQLGALAGSDGTLVLSPNSTATVAKIPVASDCPAGPNCTAMITDHDEDFVFAGVFGNSRIEVHNGATFNAGRFITLAAGAGSDSTMVVDGGTVNIEGIVEAPDGIGIGGLFGGFIPHKTQSFLDIGTGGTGHVHLVNGGVVNVNRIASEPLGTTGFFGVALGGDVSSGGGDGSLLIEGTNSALNVNGDAGVILIGNVGGSGLSAAGTGTTTVRSGGSINVNGVGGGIFAGASENTTGTLNVDAGGIVNAGNFLAAGWNSLGVTAGDGEINVNAGGNVLVEGPLGGVAVGYKGVINVDGTGAELRTRGAGAGLNIGATGIPDPDGVATAQFNITGGAEVIVEDDGLLTQEVVGVGAFQGGRGNMLIDGAGSRLIADDGVGIGWNPTLIDPDPFNDIPGGVGVLTVANGGVLETVAGVAVGDQGTLQGNGTVIGTVFTFGNGTVAPGLSPGDLVIDGDLNMTFGGTLELEIDGPANFDRVIASGVFLFSSASTIEFSFADGVDPTILESFDIGSFLRVGTEGANVPADPLADLININFATFAGISNSFNIQSISFDPGTGFQVSATAVPLPAAFWMFGAAGALLFAQRRRGVHV